MSPDWCPCSQVPFEKLALTHRGAIVSDEAIIDESTIDGVRECSSHANGARADTAGVMLQFGVLIADGHDGPFQFELEFIKALQHFDEQSTIPVPKHEQEEVLRKEVYADEILNRRGKARV